MRFDVTFCYLAKYVRHRCRRTEGALLEARTSLEIELIEGPQEPALILGCECLPDFHGWQPFQFVSGKPVRLWRISGENFVELCRVEDFEARIRQQSGNPFDATAGDQSCLPTWTGGRSVTSYEELTATRVLRKWEDDGGAARAAAIQRRGAAMRIIDGTICVRVNDPVVTVRFVGRRVVVGFSETGRHLGDGVDVKDSTRLARRYNIDRLQEALTHAGHLACHYGLRLSPTPFLSITAPFSPKLAQEGEHLYDAARILVQAMITSADSWSDSVRNALSSLEEASYRSPHGHATEGMAVTMEQLLTELAQVTDFDTWPPLPSTVDHNETGLRPIRDLEDGVPVIAARAQENLRRWRERPIEEHDWSHRALPLAVSSSFAIEQLISRLQVDEVAKSLRIATDDLLRHHLDGNLLFLQHTDQGTQVVVVATDLKVVKSIGAFNVNRTGRGLEEMKEFLSENADRREDMEALSRLW